jgi:hypothetical protein
MFLFKPALWLGSFTIVAACAAFAQPNQPAAAAPQQAAPYRSALEGYRPFSEEKVAPWAASNEAVRNAGGWRAYAREAQEGPAQVTPPMSPAAPAAPAASAPQPGHKH